MEGLSQNVDIANKGKGAKMLTLLTIIKKRCFNNLNLCINGPQANHISFKYYISILGGVGVSSLADLADAREVRGSKIGEKLFLH